MGKLRIMAAVFGLLVGLAGVAHGAMTTYLFTGDVLTATKYDPVKQAVTTIMDGDFSATVVADPTSNTVKSISVNFADFITKDYDAAALSTFTSKLFSYNNSIFNLLFSKKVAGTTTDYVSINNHGATEFAIRNNIESGSACITSIHSHTPIPAAAWLLGSGLLGLIGLKRKKNELA